MSGGSEEVKQGHGELVEPGCGGAEGVLRGCWGGAADHLNISHFKNHQLCAAHKYLWWRCCVFVHLLVGVLTHPSIQTSLSQAPFPGPCSGSSTSWRFPENLQEDPDQTPGPLNLAPLDVKEQRLDSQLPPFDGWLICVSSWSPMSIYSSLVHQRRVCRHYIDWIPPRLSQTNQLSPKKKS